MCIGGLVGVLSGYFGGWVDMVLMRITDYFLVIPDLVLMIVVAAAVGAEPDPRDPRDRPAAVDDHGPDRAGRGEELRERVYVRRARIGRGRPPVDHGAARPAADRPAADRQHGASRRGRDLRRDLAGLPRSRRPEQVSWGTILEHANDRTAASNGAWWAVVPAGLCIAAVIVGCYLLGRRSRTRSTRGWRSRTSRSKGWRLRPSTSALAAMGRAGVARRRESRRRP